MALTQADRKSDDRVMRRLRAIVVGPFDDDALRHLTAAVEVAHVPEIALERVRPHLPDAEVLITRRLTVDRAVYDAAPRLRLIVKLGTGIDEIDVAEAGRRDITVTNTAGANAPSVAELTVGLMVGVVRDIGGHHARLRRTRRWDRDLGLELYGKTLGIIGVGNVGSRVARLGLAMEMRVIGCDPYIDPTTAPVPLVSFDAVFSESDIVSLHVPLTEETRSLVNKRALALARPGTFLVNTSRGEVVDDAAVIGALNNGRLAGYAADVLPDEIPGMEITSPLLDHERVLLTPHLGAWAEGAHRRVCRAAADIVHQWVARRPQGAP